MLRIMVVATFSALCRDLWPVARLLRLGFCALGIYAGIDPIGRFSVPSYCIGDPTTSLMVRPLPAE